MLPPALLGPALPQLAELLFLLSGAPTGLGPLFSPAALPQGFIATPPGLGGGSPLGGPIAPPPAPTGGGFTGGGLPPGGDLSGGGVPPMFPPQDPGAALLAALLGVVDQTSGPARTGARFDPRSGLGRSDLSRPIGARRR